MRTNTLSELRKIGFQPKTGAAVLYQMGKEALQTSQRVPDANKACLLLIDAAKESAQFDPAKKIFKKAMIAVARHCRKTNDYEGFRICLNTFKNVIFKQEEMNKFIKKVWHDEKLTTK